MTKRNDNRKQPQTGGSKGSDTEFGAELDNFSKKARKRAAREAKSK
ncbi:hypothetical protein [Anaerobacillus alkalilacustris]|nr:hypothetical protein [Anaerobacillus alkalilacustris]